MRCSAAIGEGRLSASLAFSLAAERRLAFHKDCQVFCLYILRKQKSLCR